MVTLRIKSLNREIQRMFFIAWRGCCLLFRFPWAGPVRPAVGFSVLMPAGMRPLPGPREAYLRDPELNYKHIDTDDGF